MIGFKFGEFSFSKRINKIHLVDKKKQKVKSKKK
jgi:ribosomal protein S19